MSNWLWGCAGIALLIIGVLLIHRMAQPRHPRVYVAPDGGVYFEVGPGKMMWHLTSDDAGWEMPPQPADIKR